jgi:hypothetical protein
MRLVALLVASLFLLLADDAPSRSVQIEPPRDPFAAQGWEGVDRGMPRHVPIPEPEPEQENPGC